jgi:hypothetical protein
MSPPIDPLALAGAKSRGKRPYFLENADSERLMNILLVVVQELSVTRERLDTLERLLARNGAIGLKDIDAFAPTKAEADARGRWTQEYLARVFRVLQQENEALVTDDETPESIADELART